MVSFTLGERLRTEDQDHRARQLHGARPTAPAPVPLPNDPLSAAPGNTREQLPSIPDRTQRVMRVQPPRQVPRWGPTHREPQCQVRPGPENARPPEPGEAHGARTPRPTAPGNHPAPEHLQPHRPRNGLVDRRLAGARQEHEVGPGSGGQRARPPQVPTPMPLRPAVPAVPSPCSSPRTPSLPADPLSGRSSRRRGSGWCR